MSSPLRTNDKSAAAPAAANPLSKLGMSSSGNVLTGASPCVAASSSPPNNDRSNGRAAIAVAPSNISSGPQHTTTAASSSLIRHKAGATNDFGRSGLSHDDEVIARLDGLMRLMTETNSMLCRVVATSVSGSGGGGGLSHAAEEALAAAKKPQIGFVSADAASGKSISRLRVDRQRNSSLTKEDFEGTAVFNANTPVPAGPKSVGFSSGFSTGRLRTATERPEEGKSHWARARRILLEKVRLEKQRQEQQQEQQQSKQQNRGGAVPMLSVSDASSSSAGGALLGLAQHEVRSPSAAGRLSRASGRNSRADVDDGGGPRSNAVTPEPAARVKKEKGVSVVSIVEAENMDIMTGQDSINDILANTSSNIAAIGNNNNDGTSANGMSPDRGASPGGSVPRQRHVVRSSPIQGSAAADKQEGCLTTTIDPESWMAFVLDISFILTAFVLVFLAVTFLVLPQEHVDEFSFTAAVVLTAVCQFVTAIWVASRFQLQSRGHADGNPFMDVNPEQEWDIIDSLEAIRSKYLEFWFWFDLIYAIPFEFLGIIASKEVFFYCMIRHVMRFLRIGTVGRSSNPLRENEQQVGMVLSGYFSVIVIILHFFSSLFVRFEYDYVQSHPEQMAEVTRATGVAPANFTILDGWYWSVATLSSVGYGDLVLYSRQTRVLAIIGCCAGIIVVATSAAVATRALTEKDILEEEISRSKKMMHSMLRHFQLPWRLQKEVILLFPAVLKAQSEGSFREMIRVLPSFLGAEVESYLRAKMLAKVPLFSNLGDESERILLTLSRSLEQVFAAPNELIIRAGELGLEMFLLCHGVTEVLLPINDEEDVPVATLRSGSYFGEIALIEDSVRTASVQAVTACDLLVLGREEFVAVVQQHPVLQAKVKVEIAKRREEMARKTQQNTTAAHQRRKSSIGRQLVNQRNSDDDDDDDNDDDKDAEGEEGAEHHDSSNTSGSIGGGGGSSKKFSASDVLVKSLSLMREQRQHSMDSPRATNFAPLPVARPSPPASPALGPVRSTSGSAAAGLGIPERRSLNSSRRSTAVHDEAVVGAIPADQAAAAALQMPTVAPRHNDDGRDDIFEEDMDGSGSAHGINPLKASGSAGRSTSWSKRRQQQQQPQPQMFEGITIAPSADDGYAYSHSGGGGGGSSASAPGMLATLSATNDIPIMLSRPVTPAGDMQGPTSSSLLPHDSHASSIRTRKNSFRSQQGPNFNAYGNNNNEINIESSPNSGRQQQQQPQQSALGLLSGRGLGAAPAGSFHGFDGVRSRGASPLPARSVSPYQQ